MTIEVRTFTYVKKREGKPDLTHEVDYIVDTSSGFVTDDIKIVVPMCNYAQISIAEEDVFNDDYIAERLTTAIQKWAKVEQAKRDEETWRANNPHQFRLYTGADEHIYVTVAEAVTTYAAGAGLAGIVVASEYGKKQKLEEGTLYVTIYAHRPGRAIGKSGITANSIRDAVKTAVGREVHISIEEAPSPFTGIKFNVPPTEDGGI